MKQTAFWREKTESISYLLTYSMVQSPSWEANWSAASQEIPRISRNPKVHYRTHKRPPPVSILGQPKPVPFLAFKKRITDRISQSAAPSIVLNMFNAQDQT